MSAEPRKAKHLQLERQEAAPLTPLSERDLRVLEVQKVAFDHARGAGRRMPDANDAAQHAVLKYLELIANKPDSLPGTADRQLYTKEIVRNYFNGQYRGHMVHAANENWVGQVMAMLRDDEDPLVTIEELITLDEAEKAAEAIRLGAVWKQIDSLPAQQKQTFLDRHQHEQTIPEIASKGSKKEGTVRVQICHALAAVREGLGVVVPRSGRARTPKNKTKALPTSTKPELMP